MLAEFEAAVVVEESLVVGSVDLLSNQSIVAANILLGAFLGVQAIALVVVLISVAFWEETHAKK